MSSRELTPKKFFAPRSPFRQGWGRARPRERAARRRTPCYSLYHVCRTLAAHLDLPCLQIRQPRLPSPCGATTPCLQPPPSLPSLARRQVGDSWTRRLCQQVSTLFVPLRNDVQAPEGECEGEGGGRGLYSTLFQEKPPQQNSHF